MWVCLTVIPVVGYLLFLILRGQDSDLTRYLDYLCTQGFVHGPEGDMTYSVNGDMIGTIVTVRIAGKVEHHEFDYNGNHVPPTAGQL